jgi:RHS repeat-associated protein
VHPQAEYSGDYNELLYLRARLYAPSMGRFLTKDTWEGDYSRPLSLNRWNYVEGNPVNYTDPSGNIPSPDDVNHGRAIYSCNCGWIDFGHANSTLALSVIDLLKEEGKRFPTTSDLKQNAFAISPGAEIRIWLGKETVSLTAVVAAGLNKSTKDSVALGIYRSLEEKVEFRQGEAGEWFTYFSFEDLTSDQIGFYLAQKYGKIVNPANGGLEKNEIAWRDLSNVCGFPENRQQAVLRSQQVYNSMNASGPGSLWGDPFMRLLVNTTQVFTWGTPLLCELSGICDDQPKRWPAELNAVTPAQSIRNGLWWFYDPNLDGELVGVKNNPQFYYLKK